MSPRAFQCLCYSATCERVCFYISYKAHLTSPHILACHNALLIQALAPSLTSLRAHRHRIVAAIFFCLSCSPTLSIMLLYFTSQSHMNRSSSTAMPVTERTSLTGRRDDIFLFISCICLVCPTNKRCNTTCPFGQIHCPLMSHIQE